MWPNLIFKNLPTKLFDQGKNIPSEKTPKTGPNSEPWIKVENGDKLIVSLAAFTANNRPNATIPEMVETALEAYPNLTSFHSGL